jgi:hypothetical protein
MLRLRTAGLVVAILAGGVATIPVTAAPAAAGGGSQTFSYTGGAQSFTVPAGITSVTVDARGGLGGNAGSGGIAEGLAGHTVAILAVTPGESLQVNVGGAGETASCAVRTPHRAAGTAAPMPATTPGPAAVPRTCARAEPT